VRRVRALRLGQCGKSLHGEFAIKSEKSPPTVWITLTQSAEDPQKCHDEMKPTAATSATADAKALREALDLEKLEGCAER
jgi:hypothetical protein